MEDRTRRYSLGQTILQGVSSQFPTRLTCVEITGLLIVLFPSNRLDNLRKKRLQISRGQCLVGVSFFLLFFLGFGGGFFLKRGRG